jgi:ribosome maturation factor RimP
MTAIEDIRDLAAPLLAGTGLELWDVEITRDVVRVLVDRDGGIDLEALSEASSALSTLLDDHPEAAPGTAYQLEVSSPGIERTLRTPEQCRRYVGALVTIKTSVTVEGTRRWRGTLVAVGDDGVDLLPDDGPADRPPVSLRFDQIDRTRTVLVWGPAPKPPGGSARRADPRSRSDAVRAVRSGADVKETP